MFDRLRSDILDDSKLTPWLPAVDITEQAEQYVVKVELPGVKKEDVRITLQDDVLTIRGEKKQEAEQKDNLYHRIERSYGTFQRSFTLSASVKSDKIEASYDNGVLSIELPKTEEVKPREIEVKVK